MGKIVEWGATTWADMFYEGTISRLGRVAEERARKQHEAQEANDENLREAIRTTALQSGGTAVGTTS